MAGSSQLIRTLDKALRAASISQDWDAAIEAMVRALEQASGAAEIRRIATLPGADEAFFGEADLGAAASSALLRRVDTFAEATDAAQGAAWSLRAAAFYPLACVAPPSARPRLLPKPEASAALAAAHAMFARWLDTESPAQRASAALGLCWSREPKLEDWTSRARAERDPLAKASLLLLLAAHTHAASASLRAELAGLASLSRGGKPSLLTFAALVLAAHLGPMDAPSTEALCRHVTKGVATPPEWGWFGADRKPIKTSIAALTLLAWVQLEDAGPLLEALVGAKRPKSKGEARLLAEALVHAAFEARGKTIARSGITSASLDALQRQALRALSEPAFEGLVPRRLGLPTHDGAQLGAFLSATEPSWRPLASSQSDHPHFSALVARACADAISRDAAIEAILAGLSPQDCVLLACSQSAATMATEAALSEGLDGQARAELCLELVQRAEEAGADVTSLLEGVLHPRGHEPYADRGLWADKPVVACALLDRSTGELSDALLALLEDAMGAARAAEPLRRRIVTLPTKVRAPLLERLTVSPNSVPFVALEVSSNTVGKLVRFAVGPWGDTEGARVEDALVSMGATVPELIDGVALPSPEQRALVEALRDRVSARLRDASSSAE